MGLALSSEWDHTDEPKLSDCHVSASVNHLLKTARAFPSTRYRPILKSSSAGLNFHSLPNSMPWEHELPIDLIQRRLGKETKTHLFGIRASLQRPNTTARVLIFCSLLLFASAGLDSRILPNSVPWEPGLCSTFIDDTRLKLRYLSKNENITFAESNWYIEYSMGSPPLTLPEDPDNDNILGAWTNTGNISYLGNSVSSARIPPDSCVLTAGYYGDLFPNFPLEYVLDESTVLVESLPPYVTFFFTLHRLSILLTWSILTSTRSCIDSMFRRCGDSPPPRPAPKPYPTTPYQYRSI